MFLSLSLSHTHTHTRTHVPAQSHSHTIARSLSLSLSLFIEWYRSSVYNAHCKPTSRARKRSYLTKFWIHSDGIKRNKSKMKKKKKKEKKSFHFYTDGVTTQISWASGSTTALQLGTASVQRLMWVSLFYSAQEQPRKEVYRTIKLLTFWLSWERVREWESERVCEREIYFYWVSASWLGAWLES